MLNFRLSCIAGCAPGLVWFICVLTFPLQAQQALVPLPLAAPATNQPAAAVPEQRPRILDVTEIASAAQIALAVIRKIETDLAVDPKVVDAVRSRLEAWEGEVLQNAHETRDVIRRTGSLTNLEEHKDSWLNDQDKFKSAMTALTKHTQSLGLELGKVEQLRQMWRNSINAMGQDTPAEVASQARKILEQLDSLVEVLIQRRNQAVVIQSRLADIELAVDGVIQDIHAAHALLESRLLTRDTPALWTALWEDGSHLSIASVTREWQSRMESLRAYYDSNQTRFVVQGSLMAASVLLVFLLRRSALSFKEEMRKGQAVVLLLRRPISVGLIVALFLNPLIHPRSVLGFRLIWVPIIVFVIVRLLLVLVEPPARRGVILAAVFYVVDYARALLWNVPTLERLILLLEAVSAMLCLFFLPASIITDARGRRVWRVVRKVLLVLLGLGAFCILIGFSGLGRLLTYATVRSPLLACGHLAMYYVLSSTVGVALLTPAAKRLRMVARHPDLVARYLDRGIAVLVGLIFASRLMTTYAIHDPVLEWLGKVLSAPLKLGSLAVSLGDVLAFALVLWLSFKTSRFIRFVFQEDVFSRMSLPRGVPYAASSAMHYAVLMVGFFVAIMAAGVDMSRLTILGGAVGLGVGFGLQNIVNNFVSGLILLFERPIQVGDRIEVDTTSGQVQRIGIRSSTVRTYDGAEVIVPNSDLIANKLTNWTLSDQRRRIVIAIGVKYGTDPERILKLLLQVGRGHPDVLQQPSPEAFFRAHGESSLDFELRVWTDRASDWVRIHSELTVAINRLFTAEGIEIPFPQRDLHVRSSDLAGPASVPLSPVSGPTPPPDNRLAAPLKLP